MNSVLPVVDRISALSDLLRVRLLALLDGRELAVSELCEVLQLPQSTVSRHLKTLSDAGWARSRAEGTTRLYTLPADDVDPGSRRIWHVVRDQFGSSSTAAEDERRLTRIVEDRQSKSQEFFSSSAGQWDRLREEMFGATSHLRAMLALVDRGSTIGDLGCGTGRVSEWLAPFVDRVIAVDGSREMLRTARRALAPHRNVELRQGTLDQLPIESGELDAALMMLVLHHLAEPERALAEAARTLRRGGHLVVMDMLPHAREEYRQSMGHVWLGFTEKQVSAWLTSAGLADVRWNVLTPDPKVKGPSLFVAGAWKPRRGR